MRYAHVAALALIYTVPVPAQPCATGVCPTVTPTVVTPAVVTPLVLPAYGASYVGGGDDETKELLKKILEKLDQLSKPQPIPPSPDGPPVPPLAAQAPKVDPFAVIKDKCAKCHTGDAAKGDFQLMTDDAKYVRLNGVSRKAVLDRIDGRGGVMPPPPNKALSQAEKDAIRAAFADAKK